LIDWRRIAAKNGWLAAKPGKVKHEAVRSLEEADEKAAASLADPRAEYGLAGAYGPKAAALGLGHEKPPPRRPPPKAAIVSGP
jgi:hypothetical protein